LKFLFTANPALHATVDLGDELHRLWVDGGRRGEGISELENNQIRIDQPDARIDGLALAAGALYYPQVQVYAALNPAGGRIDVKPGDINLFRIVQYETEGDDADETATGGITVEIHNAQSDATKADEIANVSIVKPTCPASADGSITLTTFAEQDNMTFWWSTGDNTRDLNNIAPGTYTFVARDNTTGGVETRDIVVPSNSTLSVVTASVNSKCGLANGSAVAAATGGKAPYTYQWYYEDGTIIRGATTRDLKNEPKGLYSVQVSDGNNCTVSREIWIDEDMSMLEVYMSKGDASKATAKDGWAQADAVGMMTPFTYLWSNGSTKDRIDNISPGIYSVTVTDAMGCSVSNQIEVSYPHGQVQGVDPNGSDMAARILSIVPNPTSRESEVSYVLKHAGNVRIEIFDEVGNLVKFIEDGPKSAGDNQTQIDTRGIASGRYALRITFDGNVSSAPFVVVR